MWKQGYISPNINEHIAAYQYQDGTWVKWKPEDGPQFVFWETEEANDSTMSLTKLEETTAELEKEMETAVNG